LRSVSELDDEPEEEDSEDDELPLSLLLLSSSDEVDKSERELDDDDEEEEEDDDEEAEPEVEESSEEDDDDDEDSWEDELAELSSSLPEFPSSSLLSFLLRLFRFLDVRFLASLCLLDDLLLDRRVFRFEGETRFVDLEWLCLARCLRFLLDSAANESFFATSAIRAIRPCAVSYRAI
jgi:hypothetical protein